jgi:WD40 repeat protein
VSFAADGEQLAFGGQGGAFYGAGYNRVGVWGLQGGRGIRTFRGLSMPVERIVLSTSRQLVAALSNDWRIAIWDLDSGRLMMHLNAPRGSTADNAGLSVSSDGLMLAASAGQEARLWDATSGKLLRSVPLPPGLVDRLAYHPSGRFLLFRCETLDGQHLPIENDFRMYPRVGRIRDLLSRESSKPLAQFRRFSRRISDAVAMPDGSSFVVGGSREDHDGRTAAITRLDALSGREIWSIPDRGGSYFCIDGTGRYLAVSGESSTLRELATGREVSTLPGSVSSLGPEARFRVEPSQAKTRQVQSSGITVRDERDQVLLRLGIDCEHVSSNRITSSASGNMLAWGNVDGSVMIGELNEIQERLDELGLGWCPPSSEGPSDSASVTAVK